MISTFARFMWDFIKKTAIPLAAIASVFGLYYSSLRPYEFTFYLSFHTVIEVLSVAFSFMIFAFQWSTHSRRSTLHASILSSAFLGIAVFDLFHTLSFTGMPNFFGHSGIDKTIYFWLSARVFESTAFVLIAVTANRNIKKNSFSLNQFISAAIIIVVSWIVFSKLNLLPVMFVEGRGLTSLKVNVEFFLLSLNIFASFLFFRKYRQGIAPQQHLVLANASLVMVSTALCFALFGHYNDMLALWGHVLKIASYIFIYRGILLTELLIPYEEIDSIKKQLDLDIVNIKSLELELERARKIASLGTELGRIAHDLNNVLMIISTSAQSILKSENNSSNPMVIKRVDQIKNAAEKSRSFLQGLVNFSKNIQLDREVVNLKKAFLDYEMLFEPLISKNVKLYFESSREDSLWIIPSDLEQLVLNLVVNARDAMESREGYIRVYTEDKHLLSSVSFLNTKIPEGDYFCIVVEDNGTGIDEESLRKIFNPFFTTKPEGKGTGIGLSTVVSIMEKNQGHIQVQTEVDVGTKFILYFPKSCNLAAVMMQ